MIRSCAGKVILTEVWETAAVSPRAWFIQTVPALEEATCGLLGSTIAAPKALAALLMETCVAPGTGSGCASVGCTSGPIGADGPVTRGLGRDAERTRRNAVAPAAHPQTSRTATHRQLTPARKRAGKSDLSKS